MTDDPIRSTTNIANSIHSPQAPAIAPTDSLAVGAELFHQTAMTINGEDSTGFNVGAVYDINEHNHLLASIGSGLQNASETNLGKVAI